MTVPALLALAALLQATPDGPRPGSIEGRPPPEHASPLQALVDAARPGDRVIVPAGTYRGDLIIERPLTLAGIGRPTLVGSGTGSVIRVRSADVTIEGFDIDGVNGGDLGQDSAGVHVAGARVTVRDVHIRRTLFGIYLLASDDAVVDGNTIAGVPGLDPGEKGSGIHVWNSLRFRVTNNDIVGVRDGFYIQSSYNGLVRGNTARDLRYGLHYMFSDDNVFEDNTFENGAAGAALMYSKRLTFRRNRFLRNRGYASVGLLLKECDEVVAEDNLVADNARGIFVEGSYRNVFRGNIVAMSDMALVVYDSSHDNAFTGNAFVGNLSPLSLSGHRTDTRFEGNYWSDQGEPDLDGDGVADRPYRLSNVFDHLRGNMAAADLFAPGVAARALGAAERAFPVLDPVAVVDERPLARMPRLPKVPMAEPAGGATSRLTAAHAWPAGLLLAGAALFAAGRSRLARQAAAQGSAA